jgi:putative adenylate-forming enzyme
MDIKMVMKLLLKRKQLRAQEHWTRQQLEGYQTQALRCLREYAYAHSPFYQRFHKGLYDVPLQELPVLTKAMVMEHFDDLVTDRAIHLQDVKAYVATRQGDERFLGRYVVNSTSGSSGYPGLFLANCDEWATMLTTALVRVFEEADIKLKLTHRTKMAQITTTNPSHMTAQGGKSASNWWMPIMLLSASEPVTTIVKRLNDWQPEAVIAYASMLRILADEQLAGRLRIAPRAVISGSEVLTQETRRRAVQAWSDVLFNNYGTSDCGGIGAECNQHRGIHLQEDLAIIEVVDKNNRPVPAGIYGEKLLVTVLGSRTQPLIRYELEDSLRLSSEQCPCGRPFKLIDDIQGRVHEILSFPAGAGGSVNVHPIVFHNIMDTLPVNGWQVVQETDGLHLLLSGARGTLDEEGLAGTVWQALAEQGAVVPRIEVQRVDVIPQAASGKTPLVKSNLPH